MTTAYRQYRHSQTPGLSQQPQGRGKKPVLVWKTLPTAPSVSCQQALTGGLHPHINPQQPGSSTSQSLPASPAARPVPASCPHWDPAQLSWEQHGPSSIPASPVPHCSCRGSSVWRGLNPDHMCVCHIQPDGDTSGDREPLGNPRADTTMKL